MNENYLETLKNYESTLAALNDKCVEAEKGSIVAETNLTNLNRQLEDLTKEAESIAGCSFDKIADLIEEEKKKLSDIMADLSSIDLTGNMNAEKMDIITKVAKKYGITVEEVSS